MQSSRSRARGQSSRRGSGKASKNRIRLISATSEGNKTIVIPNLPFNQKKISLVQWDDVPHVITCNTTSASFYVYNFTAATLADSTVFGSFEAYRITAVDIVYKPNNLVGQPLSTTTITNGFAGWYAYDPDDNSVLTTLPQLQSKNTAVVHSMFEPWEMTIHPRPSRALYSGGAFSGYEISEGPVWVDSDNLSVPHYGFKVGLPASPQNAGGVLCFRYHIDVIMNE